MIALLGFPISHSASPAMHQAALDFLGIVGKYELWSTKIHELSDAVKALRDLKYWGANVTLPHKSSVLSLVDTAEESAKRAGAANVLYPDKHRWVAANTDGEGLVRSLTDVIGSLKGVNIAWLGTGGVTWTAGSVLLEKGASLQIFGRQKHSDFAERFELPYQRIDCSKMKQVFPVFDLLIQATSATMQEESIAREFVEKIPVESLPAHALVCDLVYRPRQTLLLQKAKQVGLEIIEGKEMLLYQAVGAFERFTGQTAPIQVMRAALESELGDS